MLRLPKPTRPIRAAALIIVLLVSVVAGVAWLLLTGSKPLINGQRLADGKVTVVKDGFIAAYIVELDEGVALVDATMDPEARSVRSALAARGFEPGDVRAIFLTHGHGDHIAGARAFPGSIVYAHADDADLVAGQRTSENLPGRFRQAEPTGITVDRELSDGDVIDLDGTKIEVFALPGHTRGSVAYLVHGVLFLGDSAGAAADDRLVAAPPVFSWDRDINRESLHELADRVASRSDEIDALAFGHQGPLEGLSALVDWHRKNR